MLLDLTTDIGKVFDVRRVSLTEGINTPFSIDIVCVADLHNIDLEAVVGRFATLRATIGSFQRTWTGWVSNAEQMHGMERGPDGTVPLSTYFIRIVPEIWLLKQRTNYKIYQRLSIPEIIDELLDKWELETPRVWRIHRDQYPKLEYKCQYNETDFQFLSRLLEEAGITYLLMDLDGRTSLVFNDQPTGEPLRKDAIPYKDTNLSAVGQPFVEKLQLRHDVRPGAFKIIDYDFRNPSYRLFGDAKEIPGPEARYEQVKYEPGGFLIESKPSDTPTADENKAWRRDAKFGGVRAQRALDGGRGGKRHIEFDTNVLDLQPGTVFKVEHHPHPSLEKPLMITAFELNADRIGEWHMRGTAIFADDPYRPARHTAKPLANAVQSATVVGPPGQEIHTDEFGRVRVQFPWDRDGAFDNDAGCWIRVNQGWAGTGFGMINIPRIGQEVMIGFMDGDPDVPVIVGRLFNQLNPVPYKLPEHKTISGWRTNSTPTTPTNVGYNEIKLEDRAQKELFYVQAQRDLHALIKRDETRRIDRKHHRTVVDDQHLQVKKIKKEWIQVDDHLHVQGDRFQQIDKSTSMQIGIDRDEKVGNKHALEVGKEIHMKSGHDVVIEAGDSLTIKGPGGFIRIHETGIDIVGLIVNINSGGTPGVGSGAHPTTPMDAEEAIPRCWSEEIED